MNLWIGLSWVAAGGSFLALLSVVAWMLIRRRRAENVDGIADVITNGVDDSLGFDTLGFDIEHYRPMERLLSDEDLVFLESQPGYRAEIGKRWKRERRRIFRMYLGELRRDFGRLHAEARRLAAHAEAGSDDLVWMLMRQRLTFLCATAQLEARLALAAAGLGTVDAAPLIALLEAMRVDLSRRSALEAA
jgi:hypothetical protein